MLIALATLSFTFLTKEESEEEENEEEEMVAKQTRSVIEN
jgi:hypothetical protein